MTAPRWCTDCYQTWIHDTHAIPRPAVTITAQHGALCRDHYQQHHPDPKDTP